MAFFSRLEAGIKRRRLHSSHNRRLIDMADAIKDHSPQPDGDPVLIFNASTRLGGISLNAAFSLLTGWSLRLHGIPVVQLVCRAGLKPCVLGTDRAHPENSPPCSVCMDQSLAAFQAFENLPLEFLPDPELDQAISHHNLAGLLCFEYESVPLGSLVLPSLRWILRKYQLEDTPQTRQLCSDYLRSAWNIYRQSVGLFKQRPFRSVIVFNGMFYPEAALRLAARRAGIPVITHEVGLAPMSAFFTYGDATAYPIHLSDDFHLNDKQNQKLDEYLERRFQGNFSMAGVRFWSGMEKISDELLEKASAFKQIVPVFTNVIFDTSQDHANVLFDNMFDWLEQTEKIIRQYPDTLFVIRAHPDENRPGKESRESVADWVRQRGLDQLPNVVFIQPDQPLSSYDLILRSKFVMVYNSTIGLEASILGMPVLCGGKARFTQVPTVFFPPTREDYVQMAVEFLNADGIIVPPEYMQNARRFLYNQLFCVSLPFSEFLEEDPYWKGYVLVKEMEWTKLRREHSDTIRVILDGILEHKPFSL